MSSAAPVFVEAHVGEHPAAPRAVRWIVPVLIGAGLAIDQHGGPFGQTLVVLATWLVFAALLWRSATPGRVMLGVCLTYATIGELLLSLVWRVYDYRLGNLPLFVPPGHVLLFLLGLSLAPRLSLRAVQVITTTAVLAVSYLAATKQDTFSLLLVSVFAVSVLFGRERQLYATMFVLALAMELYGTWLGNWRWSANVAQTGMVTLNPPIAAGAFYCALDLLVMWTMRRLMLAPAPRNAP